MKLIYTAKAIESLDEIFEFLHQKNEHAAVFIHNHILDEADKLLAHPQMASIEPLLKGEVETYRSLVVRHNYKIVYRVEGEIIYIVDIWDCRQQPERLKRRITKRK